MGSTMGVAVAVAAMTLGNVAMDVLVGDTVLVGVLLGGAIGIAVLVGVLPGATAGVGVPVAAGVNVGGTGVRVAPAEVGVGDIR